MQTNGGILVKLEKLADVIIADHARKDAPQGSVSWKYIHDCIHNHELADIDKFRIQGPAGPAGPARGSAGRSAPIKQTRNFFTAEEDRRLQEWAKDQPYAKGNEIYKEFAEQVGIIRHHHSLRITNSFLQSPRTQLTHGNRGGTDMSSITCSRMPPPRSQQHQLLSPPRGQLLFDSSLLARHPLCLAQAHPNYRQGPLLRGTMVIPRRRIGFSQIMFGNEWAKGKGLAATGYTRSFRKW